MTFDNTTAQYKLDLSNGLSEAIFATVDDVKIWTLNGLILNQYPTDLTLIGSILTQTLADGSVLDVNLSSLSGSSVNKYPTSLTYTSLSKVLEITLSDSSKLSTSITFTDVNVSSLVFNGVTNLMSLTETDGSLHTADLSSLSADTNTTLRSVSYATETKILSIQDSDLTTITVDLTNSQIPWTSIGSVDDSIGSFDVTYTTSPYIIPHLLGNVTLMLDTNPATCPAGLALPKISDTVMGWECNMLIYDSSGNVGSKSISVDGNTASMYNDISDPLHLIAPYGELTSTMILECGHFYRIKKINSNFYLMHYK